MNRFCNVTLNVAAKGLFIYSKRFDALHWKCAVGSIVHVNTKGREKDGRQ